MLARVLLDTTQASDVPEETTTILLYEECMTKHHGVMYALMLTIYCPTLGQFAQKAMNLEHV